MIEKVKMDEMPVKEYVIIPMNDQNHKAVDYAKFLIGSNGNKISELRKPAKIFWDIIIGNKRLIFTWNASSTCFRVLALVSMNGMPKERANSWMDRCSMERCCKSHLLPTKTIGT
jgi:hypothetical protein